VKKTIALVVLLAAMGCSKAKDAASDCDAPINKGMDNFTETVKQRGSNSPMAAAMLGVVDKLRTTFIQRCHEDKWPTEASACIAGVKSQADVKACEDKLTPDQKTKLHNAVREIMMSSMRAGTIPGHPAHLQGRTPEEVQAGVPAGAMSGSGSAAAPAGAAPAGAAPAAGSGAAPAAGSAAGSAAPAGGW
jgi:hypothetical protein